MFRFFDLSSAFILTFRQHVFCKDGLSLLCRTVLSILFWSGIAAVAAAVSFEWLAPGLQTSGLASAVYPICQVIQSALKENLPMLQWGTLLFCAYGLITGLLLFMTRNKNAG